MHIAVWNVLQTDTQYNLKRAGLSNSSENSNSSKYLSGGCACFSAILNYLCNGASVSTIYQVILICYAGLSAPLRYDFSPYYVRPVNLASIQTQPPYEFVSLLVI
ncbi:MAG: hypothetical protein Q8K77_06530, partial [Thermodesulfovibrionales bacterium]|nr:hypothetical protein [Thermodesulfovibrionales bacterium]